MGEQITVANNDDEAVKAVKRRLSVYREREHELDIKLERLEMLISRMRSVGSPGMSDSPMAHGSCNDRMSLSIERVEELREIIDRLISSQRAERRVIEAELEQLDSIEEREIIRIRYFERNGWDDTARIMFGERPDFVKKRDKYARRMFRLHGTAIIHIAEVETGRKIIAKQTDD